VGVSGGRGEGRSARRTQTIVVTRMYIMAVHARLCCPAPGEAFRMHSASGEALPDPCSPSSQARWRASPAARLDRCARPRPQAAKASTARTRRRRAGSRRQSLGDPSPCRDALAPRSGRNRSEGAPKAFNGDEVMGPAGGIRNPPFRSFVNQTSRYEGLVDVARQSL